MSFFLFPGQGSQQPGMGADFYERSAVARETLDRASDVLGDGFLSRMFAGPAEALKDTNVAQVALVTCGVAIARHLIEGGVVPSGVAGHSVGELAALVVADTIGFEDALRITRERARLMSTGSAPGGMAAVLGLDADTIRAALPAGAEVANYNGPQQTIISGSLEGLEAAAAALKSAGAKRVIPLPVSGPFHSSFMKPAAERFQEFLAAFSLKRPGYRFVSSVTGVDETDPERIRALLSLQLYSPVLWTDVMRSVGPSAALELGPGTVLQGLAKRMEGGPRVESAGTHKAAALRASS